RCHGQQDQQARGEQSAHGLERGRTRPLIAAIIAPAFSEDSSAGRMAEGFQTAASNRRATASRAGRGRGSPPASPPNQTPAGPGSTAPISAQGIPAANSAAQMLAASGGGAASSSAPDARAARGSRPKAAHTRLASGGTGAWAGSNRRLCPQASANSHS